MLLNLLKFSYHEPSLLYLHVSLVLLCHGVAYLATFLGFTLFGWNNFNRCI